MPSSFTISTIATGMFLMGTCCHALEIELVYDDAFQEYPQAVAMMDEAATIWESLLHDPVSIVIEVHTEPVGDLIFTAGIAYANYDGYAYEDVRQALLNDAASGDDLLATEYLPPPTSIAFRTVTPEGEPILNSSDDPINQYLLLTHANAKALGIPVTLDPTLPDGMIGWNEFYLEHWFDYDRSDGVTDTDFLSSALHEIGHLLGLYSGVDDVDYTSLPNGPDAPVDLSEYAILWLPDLFRFTADSLPYPDVAPGGAPYFSIDGGATSLAPFATGTFNGDGDQASHWKYDVGLMSTFIPDDTAVDPTAVDLRLFDVIGWDIDAHGMEGDLNGDQMVDGDDLDFWQANFGAGGLSGADFLTWQRHYNPRPVYDVTILDGTTQVGYGEPVDPPLSVDLQFDDVLSPYSDGFLEISVAGDFDADGENMLVYAESQALGTLFIEGSPDPTAVNVESLTIPLSILELLAADGVIDIQLKGTASTAVNVNEMTVHSVRLKYAKVPTSPTTAPEPATNVLIAIGAVMTAQLVSSRRRGQTPSPQRAMQRVRGAAGRSVSNT